MDSYKSEDSSSEEDDSSSRGSEHVDVWSEDEANYETDLTDPTDVADSARLLADDEHPPKYYTQPVDNFDEFEDAKDYKPSTTILLVRIEEQWFM